MPVNWGFLTNFVLSPVFEFAQSKGELPIVSAEQLEYSRFQETRAGDRAQSSLRGDDPLEIGDIFPTFLRGRSCSTGQPSSSEKLMNDQKLPGGIEADLIRDLERARLRALVDGNIEMARELHAPDFQLITPTGRSLSGEGYLDEIASGQLKYVLWEPAEIHVHLCDHIAIIRYQSELEVIANGCPIPRARYWHTDSYRHKNAKWQVVWSQATKITL
jgi:Domain of unknown function (DUF4440)